MDVGVFGVECETDGRIAPVAREIGKKCPNSYKKRQKYAQKHFRNIKPDRLLVRYHGLAPASDVERYVMEFVEICRAPPTLLSRLAGDLSPLESSWVGLLRALIIRPELLLVSGYLPRETLVADYGVWRFFEEVVQPMRMTILVDAGPQALPIHPESRLLVMNQGTLLAAGLASELRDHPDARVQRYARADHA